MIGTDDEDAFVSRCVIALVTTVRANGTPSTSMVSFVRRGDRLFFTTTLERHKGRSLARDPRCGLTVLDPYEPWSYVSVEGGIVIHRDNPPDLRQIFLDRVDHPDYPWSREEIEPMLVAPSRAIFELIPSRVTSVLLPRG